MSGPLCYQHLLEAIVLDLLLRPSSVASFSIMTIVVYLIFCLQILHVNDAITHYYRSELCVKRARVGGCCPEITLFSNRVSFACESDNTVTDTLVRCGLYRLHQYYIGLAVVAPKPSTDSGSTFMYHLLYSFVHP